MKYVFVITSPVYVPVFRSLIYCFIQILFIYCLPFIFIKNIFFVEAVKQGIVFLVKNFIVSIPLISLLLVETMLPYLLKYYFYSVPGNVIMVISNIVGYSVDIFVFIAACIILNEDTEHNNINLIT